MGWNPQEGGLTRIFTNDYGEFRDSGIVLPGLETGEGSWFDFNWDGDLDILLTGWTGTECRTHVIQKQYDGTYQEVTTPIVDVEDGHAAWGYDGVDARVDLLITGWATTVRRPESTIRQAVGSSRGPTRYRASMRPMPHGPTTTTTASRTSCSRAGRRQAPQPTYFARTARTSKGWASA